MKFSDIVFQKKERIFRVRIGKMFMKLSYEELESVELWKTRGRKRFQMS